MRVNSMPHIESKTEKGYKFFFLSIILFVFWQLIIVVLSYSMRNDLEEFATRQADNDPNALESIASYIGPLCGIMIVLLAVMVFIMIGFKLVLNGRAEFGQKQAKNTEIGLGLMISGFILALIGSVVVGFGQSNSQNNSLNGVYVTLTIITSFLYGFGFLFLLKQQLDLMGVKYLKIGIILFILINILNMSFAVYLNTEQPSSANNNIIIVLMLNAAISIPWSIFAYSFYRAWKILQRDEIKPAIPISASISQTITNIPGGKPNACPSCGFIIDDEATECPKCGFYLKED